MLTDERSKKKLCLPLCQPLVQSAAHSAGRASSRSPRQTAVQSDGRPVRRPPSQPLRMQLCPARSGDEPPPPNAGGVGAVLHKLGDCLAAQPRRRPARSCEEAPPGVGGVGEVLHHLGDCLVGLELLLAARDLRLDGEGGVLGACPAREPLLALGQDVLLVRDPEVALLPLDAVRRMGQIALQIDDLRAPQGAGVVPGPVGHSVGVGVAVRPKVGPVLGRQHRQALRRVRGLLVLQHELEHEEGLGAVEGEGVQRLEVVLVEGAVAEGALLAGDALRRAPHPEVPEGV
mmetsp:Transcript_38686/g.84145  ORF Transcript_38686/g.84145 Transcript_38686/m.84145 type:complete len:288 (-) Transcript_38686:1549-2412(-)